MMEFKTSYWHEHYLKREFIDFINEVFGLDFSTWDNYGCWDDNFRPFTFFEKGKVISSVCLYSNSCIINGEEKKIAQLSSVGTLPEYRKRGLNQELTKRAIEWAGDTHDNVYLYTSEMAHCYYQKCGFSKYPEYFEYIKVPTAAKPGKVGLEKIGLERLEMITEYVNNRAPVSKRFASLSEKLMMFHVLYKLQDKLYYLEDLDIIIAIEVVDQSLVIYDIIGSNIPDYNRLEPYLYSFNVVEIQFRFHTDLLNIPDIRISQLEESHLYIYEPHKINGNLVFPYMIQA